MCECEYMVENIDYTNLSTRRLNQTQLRKMKHQSILGHQFLINSLSFCLIFVIKTAVFNLEKQSQIPDAALLM